MTTTRLVWESTDSDDDERLYEVNISAIAALTEKEVRQILVLLRESFPHGCTALRARFRTSMASPVSYQWDDDVVCWGGFEMEAETLR